ncbi:hypothetical protein [Streptomyces sp. YGL11-2]|uniref:hypothetical protein n=1 Tax=Streptomyces sp. YGL11-2 TaxID=3414028 RepID=UPI003CF5FBA3
MITTPVPPAHALRLNLAPYRNNAAFLAVDATPGDGFDGFGRACPAEQIAGAAAVLGLPDDFGHGIPDNIACEGQVLALDSPLLVSGIEVVGAGSGGAVSESLFLAPGDDSSAIGAQVELSDFLSRRPVFDDTCFAHSSFLYDIGGRAEHGAEPRLWRSSTWLTDPARCQELILPVNPDLHIMGIWLIPAAGR